MLQIPANPTVECVICLDTNNEPFFRLACGHGPGRDPMLATEPARYYGQIKSVKSKGDIK